MDRLNTQAGGEAEGWWPAPEYGLAGGTNGLAQLESPVEKELRALLEKKEEEEDYFLYRNMALVALLISTLLTVINMA